MYNQNKLEIFSKTVYAESMAERNQIMNEIEKSSQESMDKFELEALSRVYERIRRARLELEKEYAEKLSGESFNKKRSLIAFRESLVDEVFAEAEKKLREFTKTDEYLQYISRAIEEGKAMGLKLTAEISSADMERLSGFIAENGISSITAANIKGGIRIVVEDKGIVIDKSFDTALRDKRSSFNINR